MVELSLRRQSEAIVDNDHLEVAIRSVDSGQTSLTDRPSCVEPMLEKSRLIRTTTDKKSKKATYMGILMVAQHKEIKSENLKTFGQFKRIAESRWQFMRKERLKIERRAKRQYDGEKDRN